MLPLQAFDAHLRGFRHQRRIKQAQLLQQGQEVSAMLAGLLREEEEAALVLPPPRRMAGLAVGHPARDLLLEEDAGGECIHELQRTCKWS